MSSYQPTFVKQSINIYIVTKCYDDKLLANSETLDAIRSLSFSIAISGHLNRGNLSTIVRKVKSFAD